MNCEEPMHEGGCLCRDIRYRVDGPIESVAHCHCNSCRHSAGAVFVTWVTVGREKFAWTGGAPRRYRSSPGVTREFCGRCGTELTYATERAATTIDITLGSLDCAVGHAADRHIWTADRLRWLQVDGHLPTYEGWSNES
ncbi:MAG TPA: GFA family protein [Alphaproteobacteria bacterium]|nr:GFA family protein [Alphaproteobacteria bacterium]